MNPRSFFRPELLLFLLCLLSFCLPAGAAGEEGVVERWGEWHIIFKEPVVTRTVVENASRREPLLQLAAAAMAEGRNDTYETPPSEADCGLELFSVSGSPAPRLRWVDQNKLRIDFAPGSSPETEYHLSFRPGTTYLGGAALATSSFRFRCKPVELSADLLEEHAGGAALLSASGSTTREAQALVEDHAGLRVCFRRMRYVPLVGWVCTGTVPARLRPATLADGFGRFDQVLSRLLREMKAEDIREDTPLPQCLVALPLQPLHPGAHYELGVEAAPGSGFKSGNISLGQLPAALEATLERELVQEKGCPASTRLSLRFSHPVPEAQLRALWGRLALSSGGNLATRQADGSYVLLLPGAEGEAVPPAATFRLRGLIPCHTRTDHWRGDRLCRYSPRGCAQGLEADVECEQPLELQLALPAEVQTRHGLALAGPQILSASISPAAPAMTGDGGNLIALRGEHRLSLPLVNVGEVQATACHWDAESAARLLPVIQHGMRDDTVFCELWQRLLWMRRRADEGLSTEGWMNEGDDARTEAGRALHLLQKERRLTDSLREQALAAATVFAPQALALKAEKNANGLVRKGEAELNLDQLTGGQLRPGLYLISLSYRPTAEVMKALRFYGVKGDEPALTCTVDFLVQVTDLSLRRGQDRLLVNSLSTGQPLEGGHVSLYRLPDAAYQRDEEARLDSAREEATPETDAPALRLREGEAVLPAKAGDRLLLVQQGEDYALMSLWRESVRASCATGSHAPMLKLFSDRSLYRPGEVAHLRGVLRRPVKGGLALPRARRATLTIYKPNDEVLETRELTVDAYGALAADVTLPAGEEDVAGRYRCRLKVEEGGRNVEAELALGCEVFRRDAFKATVSLSTDPIAPQQYTVNVQAVDYNGTPLAGGRVELELGSTAPLLGEDGKPAEGVVEQRPVDEEEGEVTYELRRSLVLDAGGCATLSGRFGAYEQQRDIRVSGSVSNDREEHVQMKRVERTLPPADFLFSVEGDDRLFLQDAASGEGAPLSRAQEVELSIVVDEEQRRELPSGIWYTEQAERIVGGHRLTVPANCTKGVELRPFLKGVEADSVRLRLSGRDTAGRLIRAEAELDLANSDGREYCRLRAEGRRVRLETDTPFRESGRLHACISSQGQRRHALVAVEAGAESVCIPLNPQEYGEVHVCLVSCEKDSRGLCTDWKERAARCELPRPDKQLKLEFTLPAGARPGETVALQGRVLGADGQPVKAAITLFAVDAGMMSVAPYTLPELATRFYRGEADAFSLASNGVACEGIRPEVQALPNVWSREYEGQSSACFRSVMPAGMDVGSMKSGGIGSLFRWGAEHAVRAAEPSFRWSYLLNMGQQVQYEAAPAQAPVTLQKAEDNGARRSRKARLTSGLLSGYRAEEAAEEEEGFPGDELGDGLGAGGYGLGASRPGAEQGAPAPRLRHNFEPVALWLASLESGADGCFATECRLPDTLTTYKVYAVALDAGGSCFGQAEGEFLVNQELMLTAGTPFFMSEGDRLLLPLTITNNRDEAGEWTVSLTGAGEAAAQQLRLEARSTATLFFEVTAREEGECVLQWTAHSADGGDAVESRFPVRYPAPLIKEAHRLVLAGGSEAVEAATLLAPELAGATRGEMELQYSTSPLIHLAGSMDFLLNYPYGCTEQRASALLPWLFHAQLAPFCPQMALTPAEEAQQTVARTVEQILARQQADGGLSYWAAPKGEPAASCNWASAYAALVLTIAKEEGFAVPEEALERLRDYLGRQNWRRSGHLTQYAVARARGRQGEVNRILVRALRQELEQGESVGFERNIVDLEFMASLRSNPAGRHEALLRWLRSKGKDYRHRSSWSGGWTLIALSEYLRLEPKATGTGSVRVNGEERTVASKPGSICFRPGAGQSLRDIAPTVAAGQGTSYVSIRVKAQPEQTEYPGVTEKGLQVTRVYEVKDASGQWRACTDFKVGDVVRVTLTCAKVADELEYFVLEDYLPSCMEAINPNVPSQAVGLEDGGWGLWSRWFDHKEYLADRVRGFCTRWAGRELVNMSYYARVKRAGKSTAPPAEAQLMYEPQTCGLSPNMVVQVKN